MITTYQIQNVLRVYGNQLKKRSTLIQDSLTPPQQPADLVEISIDARRKQMLSRMSNHLISKIVPENQQEKSERKVASEEPSRYVSDRGLGVMLNEEKI